MATRTRKTRGWDENYFDRGPLLLHDLAVFEPNDLTIVTGILDQHGNPIKYTLRSMDPVGFIHFSDESDETES